MDRRTFHEFVVLKTDLDPADLPVDENGVVSEAGEGFEVIDEIEDIPTGETQELLVTQRPATTSCSATSGPRRRARLTTRWGCGSHSRGTSRTVTAVIGRRRSGVV